MESHMVAAGEVVLVPVGELRPNRHNSRTHTKKQIRQVANSILRFGWTSPILVDEENVILAGHARHLAAQQLGYGEVPVIVVSGLNGAEKRALALADNKIAANAGWDRKLLAEDLGELLTQLPECKLDIEITGFEVSEISSLLGDIARSESNPVDRVPPSKTKRVVSPKTKEVSRIGDLWELGRHKLVCNDVLSAKDVERLAGTWSAALVVTGDLPIERFDGQRLREGGNPTGGCGDMSAVQFLQFLCNSPSLGTKYSVTGTTNFLLVDWPQLGEVLAAGSMLAPRYADVAIHRWQTHTQRDAILAASGQTFASVAALRGKSRSTP